MIIFKKGAKAFFFFKRLFINDEKMKKKKRQEYIFLFRYFFTYNKHKTFYAKEDIFELTAAAIYLKLKKKKIKMVLTYTSKI